MVKNQIQQRSERSQNLKVYQVGDDVFYVESSEGKICYRVVLNDDITSCTCGDYSRNSKADADFKCKHILAVFNAIPTGDLNTANLLKKKLPRLDERFIMTLEGKDFVKYPGLLDLGHQKGISTIEVDIVQTPNKENGNFAICKATVVAKNGDTFTDIGDANPANCNSKVVKHLLRMASTRSIARALRSFTNIGMTCLEELGDFDEVFGENGAKTRKRAENVTFAKPKVVPPVQENPAETETSADAQEEGPAESSAKPDAKKSKKPVAPKTPAPAQDQEPVTAGAENPDAKDEEPVMSSAQKSAIYNLARRRSISVADLEKMSKETFGLEVDYLSRQDASLFIRQLQQAA